MNHYDMKPHEGLLYCLAWAVVFPIIWPNDGVVFFASVMLVIIAIGFFSFLLGIFK